MNQVNLGNRHITLRYLFSEWEMVVFCNLEYKNKSTVNK
jgi:hypothetical protein